MIHEPLTIEEIKQLAEEYNLTYEFDDVYQIPILYSPEFDILFRATMTNGTTYSGWDKVEQTKLREKFDRLGFKRK